MNSIKIIFFDIDGTLIDMRTKRISEKMLETLIRLKENACFGQPLGHNFVVQPCHLAGGFLAHIALGHVQCPGDFAEHCQIQLGVAVNHCRFIFEEIAGEGGTADDIGAGVVEYHIGNVGNTLLN